ncbi:hypothetical protein EJB05_01902, partial [Eragrostis curvula]
ASVVDRFQLAWNARSKRSGIGRGTVNSFDEASRNTALTAELVDVASSLSPEQLRLAKSTGLWPLVSSVRPLRFDPKFCRWVSSKLNLSTKEFTIDREHSIPLSPGLVTSIFGLKACGNQIHTYPSKNKFTARMDLIRRLRASPGSTLRAAAERVLREELSPSSPEEQDRFMASFILYSLATLFGMDEKIANSICSIDDLATASRLNWAEFVHRLITGTGAKAQSRDRKSSATLAELWPGPAIFAHVLYFDHKRHGIDSVPHGDLPRARLFDAERISRLVMADTVRLEGSTPCRVFGGGTVIPFNEAPRHSPSPLQRKSLKDTDPRCTRNQEDPVLLATIAMKEFKARCIKHLSSARAAIEITTEFDIADNQEDKQTPLTDTPSPCSPVSEPAPSDSSPEQNEDESMNTNVEDVAQLEVEEQTVDAGIRSKSNDGIHRRKNLDTRAFSESFLWAKRAIDDCELNLNEKAPEEEFNTSPIKKRKVVHTALVKAPSRELMLKRHIGAASAFYSWMRIIAGEDFIHAASVQEQFMGKHVTYDIARCQLFFCVAYISGKWAACAWDMMRLQQTLYAPCFSSKASKEGWEKHKDVANNLLKAMKLCTARFFEGWEINWKQWTQVFVDTPKASCDSGNFGWSFAGEGFSQDFLGISNGQYAIVTGSLMRLDGELKLKAYSCMFGPAGVSVEYICNATGKVKEEVMFSLGQLAERGDETSSKATSFPDWDQGMFDSSFFESLERHERELEGPSNGRRRLQPNELDELDFGEIDPTLYSRNVEVGSQDVIVIGPQESCKEALQAKNQRETMRISDDMNRASILVQHNSIEPIQVDANCGEGGSAAATGEEPDPSPDDVGVLCAQPYSSSVLRQQEVSDDVDLNQLPVHCAELDELKKVQDTCSMLARMTAQLISKSMSSNNCPYRADRLIEMRDHITAVITCVEEAASEPSDCQGTKRKGKTGKASSSPVVPIDWEGEILDHEAEAKTSDMEFMPGSIGRRCTAYKRPIATIEEHGADHLSGKRRKLCGNPNCATHRHRIPVRTDALKVCDWIENKATDDMLSQLWLFLDGTPEIKMTGTEIRQRLLWQTPLDLEMASVVIRLLRELEEETIFRRPNCQGRPYVDPAWGVMVANGTICPEASFEHFMYPAPPSCCNNLMQLTTLQVLTLVCVSSNWSCYAFDFTSNVISIMDPMVRHPVEESKVIEQTAICKKLLAEVIHCMRRATGNMYMGHGKWTPKMMMAGGRKPAGVHSGIIALNCMRWYNKNSVCDPPRDGQTTQHKEGPNLPAPHHAHKQGEACNIRVG